MSKYHARKTVIDNITFDSQLEANRYCQLMVLVRAGEIYGLTVHPRFELYPKTTHDGKKLRAIVHELDFSYYEEGNPRMIVEDVKGMETAVWRLKYNLFVRRYREIEYRVIKDV